MEVTAQNAIPNTQEMVTEGVIGERHLWIAVVMRAVEDWQTGTLRARREAQKFLFDEDCDFNCVCENAGLEPDGLRTRLLRIGHRISVSGPLLAPLTTPLAA
jgi:hypothetical protein